MRAVVVQVAASGVCHTDLSVRGGGMPSLLPARSGTKAPGL
jgi:S-(hydroxymethyl)glutathione dehydrogenase/alcohol dehydrogenase